MEAHLEGLRENGDDVGAVGGGDKIERAADLFDKLVATRRSLLVHVDLVRYYHAGNVGAVVPEFLVPNFQVLVSDLSVGVEH